MPTIPIADKVTLDAVKALIGATGDAAGIGSIFARLAQIAGYTDSVEGTLATLSTSAQAAAILAYVDELEARLTATRAGYLDRLDAAISSRASATDYTAARASRLDYIQNWAGKTPQFASYQVVGQGTWQTVLNVAGAGFLLSLCQLNPAGILKITIDGVERLNRALGPYNSTMDFAFFYLHRFTSTINIQIMNNSGEGTSTVGVGYVLD